MELRDHVIQRGSLVVAHILYSGWLRIEGEVVGTVRAEPGRGGRLVVGRDARVRRKKDIVDEGKIDTLKRFKDDANEVRAGLECGIRLGDFNGYEVGDVIEVYEIQKVRASL